LRKADDYGWPDIKKQVDKLMGQIDDEFKQSLAYFH
jgi:hypothetical protein